MGQEACPASKFAAAPAACHARKFAVAPAARVHVCAPGHVAEDRRGSEGGRAVGREQAPRASPRRPRERPKCAFAAQGP
eukprot:1532334-Prorocentrum_lima.AAC.1